MERHSWLAALLAISTALCPVAARAQDAPLDGASPSAAPPTAEAPAPSAAQTSGPDDRASEQLAELSAFLERSDEPARTYRLVGGLVGLGVGGLVIPLGASIYDRDPGVGAGVTLGVGIGSAVGGALVLLGSRDRPHRDAANAIAQARGSGRGDAAALAAGEEALRRSAAEARLERLVGGGVLLGLGVTALGLGTTFATADLTSDSFDRDEQDGVAAALLVGGALATTGAVELLFSPMPDEMAWEGYAAGRKVGAAPEPRITGGGVSVLPGGGARLGLVGRF